MPSLSANEKKLGFILASLMVLAACAQPPKQEQADAEAALQTATAAGAEEFAAEDLSMAQEALADAKAKMESKDYKGAKASFLDAKSKADAATAAVEPNKQAAKTEAEERMKALETEVAALDKKVSSMKGAAAQKAEVASLKEMWKSVEADVQGGHYTVAVDKLEEVQTKIDELKTALENAKSPAKKK